MTNRTIHPLAKAALLVLATDCVAASRDEPTLVAPATAPMISTEIDRNSPTYIYGFLKIAWKELRAAEDLVDRSREIDRRGQRGSGVQQEPEYVPREKRNQLLADQKLAVRIYSDALREALHSHKAASSLSPERLAEMQRLLQVEVELK